MYRLKTGLVAGLVLGLVDCGGGFPAPTSLFGSDLDIGDTELGNLDFGNLELGNYGHGGGCVGYVRTRVWWDGDVAGSGTRIVGLGHYMVNEAVFAETTANLQFNTAKYNLRRNCKTLNNTNSEPEVDYVGQGIILYDTSTFYDNVLSLSVETIDKSVFLYNHRAEVHGDVAYSLCYILFRGIVYLLFCIVEVLVNMCWYLYNIISDLYWDMIRFWYQLYSYYKNQLYYVTWYWYTTSITGIVESDYFSYAAHCLLTFTSRLFGSAATLFASLFASLQVHWSPTMPPSRAFESAASSWRALAIASRACRFGFHTACGARSPDVLLGFSGFSLALTSTSSHITHVHGSHVSPFTGRTLPPADHVGVRGSRLGVGLMSLLPAYVLLCVSVALQILILLRLGMRSSAVAQHTHTHYHTHYHDSQVHHHDPTHRHDPPSCTSSGTMTDPTLVYCDSTLSTSYHKIPVAEKSVNQHAVYGGFETPQKTKHEIFSPKSSLPEFYCKENFTAMVAMMGTPSEHQTDVSEVDSDAQTSEALQEARTTAPAPTPPDRHPTQSRDSTPSSKLTNRIKSSFGSNSDSGSVTSDQDSIASSQSQSQSSKKEKWICESGVYPLDKQRACSLSLVTGYIDSTATDTLADELSSCIDTHCMPADKDRYRINFGHGLDCRSPKEDKKKKKIWTLNRNLDEESELTALLLNYRGKVKKAILEMLDKDIDFDMMTVNRLSTDQHSIPYETSFDPENAGFSPVVAMIVLGTSSRPLFMKTVPGNSVTHKVSLQPGSLCVLTDRTECRYKHSIPKNYGDESRFFLLSFIERSPDKQILKELAKISTPPALKISRPPTSQSNSDSTMKVKGYDVKMTDAPKRMSAPPPTHFTFDVRDDTVNDAKDFNNPSRTPETAVPLFAFKDNLDYEPNSSLLLTETLESAVNAMDDETVTAELRRNHTSTTGTTAQRKKRLVHKITLSIGEMGSQTPNNTGLNFLPNSPECDTSRKFIDELETISRTQNCIENILKDVVDSHQELRADVNVLRTSSIDNLATKPVKAEQQTVHANNESLLEFSRSIKNCGDQVKVLTEALADITDKFKQTQDDVLGLTETLNKTKTDLDNWYSSAFFDEDSGRIKDIHEIVTGSVMRFYDDEHDKRIPNEFQDPAFPRVIEEQRDAIPEPAAKLVAPPSQRFHWPNPSKVSLKTVVTNNMPISVCLITDSIMRHINELEFAQYRVEFSRIDRTDIVPGLASDNMRRRLVELQPHLIYLHLGINDIHRGTTLAEAMRSFSDFHDFLLEKLPGTKMIVSLPLLNGRAFQYRAINQLRRTLTQHIGKFSGPSMDVKDRRLFLQRNMNFVEYDGDGMATKANELFYDTSDDSLHLNRRGKEAITCSMRAAIDRVLKEHRAATA